MAPIIVGVLQLAAPDVEALVEFIVEQPAAGRIRLPPLAVDHHLRNGALADAAKNFIKGFRSLFDVDFGVFNTVSFEELLGSPAITAPGSRVDFHFHNQIVIWKA